MVVREGSDSGPGVDRRLTKETAAWTSESLCLKLWVEFRAGDSKWPSQLTTSEGGRGDRPARWGRLHERCSGWEFASICVRSSSAKVILGAHRPHNVNHVSGRNHLY